MLINGKRALAYIVTIDEIKPIPNYDRVEHARTNGWWVIISKNDCLKVGDKCVYFEIDSRVPADDDRFAFLEKRDFKVRTLRMCKVLSQGLLMPVSVFGFESLPVGADVTDKLGITYAVDEDNARKAESNKQAKYMGMYTRHKRLFKTRLFKWIMRHEHGREFLFKIFGKKTDVPLSFPDFVSKTDEERCLIAHTKIPTDQGMKYISDIVNQHLPVKVLSMNPDGTLSYKRILDYQKFDNPSGEVMTIEYPYVVGVSERKNHLCCTLDHKILTNRGYIKAVDVKNGDMVYTPVTAYDEQCIPALYGMLLGDSHIYKDKRSHGTLRVIATNGEAQLDYLKYKQSMFGDGKIIEAGPSGYGGDKLTYHWFLPVDAYIDSVVKKDFLVDGKKTVTQSVVDKLTDESLAFWYMDDGCLSHKNDEHASPSIRINTQGFSKEENDLLVSTLKNKFGVSCNVRSDHKNGKEYFVIYIDVVGTKKFLELVSPYMCKSMAYKTLPEYEELLETKKNTFAKVQRVLENPVTNVLFGQHKSVTLRSKFNTVYDLEVEDNHNFVTDSIVSHNCENLPYKLGTDEEYILTEKLDGTSATYVLSRNGKKYDFAVCSRNLRLPHPKDGDPNMDVYWEMAYKYNIENVLTEILENNPGKNWVCLQGEIIGPGIQKNPLDMSDHTLNLFNFIVDGERWPTDVGCICAKNRGIPWVPILGCDTLPNTMDDMKAQADGKSALNENKLREGIVYRSLDGKDSFKNVSNEYLLHQGKLKPKKVPANE